VRYSPSFERDWTFYLNSRSTFEFCGKTDEEIKAKIIPDPSGRSAKECFLFLDGRGEIVPCSEPDLLFEVLRVKAGINWQIRQWAEMLSGGVLMPSELVECRDAYHLPPWVLGGVLGQAVRLGWSAPWAEHVRHLLRTKT
jgi:hypothetical protein